MDPSFEEAKARFFAALAHQQARAYIAAEREYRRSLELMPGRASTLINLAAVQLRLARPQEALASAEAALAVEADSTDALLHRAAALARLGRPHDALASLRRLLALDPQHAVAWSDSGTLLRETGRLDDAAHAFHEALRHGADPELHRYYLAAVSDGAAPAAAPKAYVAGLFDSYADDFDRHLVDELRYRAHAHLVERLRALGDARYESALDLGCGTGLCGPRLRPLVGRLTGVDLSSGMLAKARALAVYDRLVQAEAVEFVAGSDERFDLVVAADVFIYVGELTPTFAALERAMTHGVFCFTVEALADDRDELRLLPSLRYAHSIAYLERLAARHGFATIAMEHAPVREDQRKSVDGVYVYLRRTASAAASR